MEMDVSVDNQAILPIILLLIQISNNLVVAVLV
jgi:hypothetical protein